MQTSNNDVVITGLGPVTSIGVGAEVLWSSLMEGRSNVATRTLPVDIGRQMDLPVASMPVASAVPGLRPHVDFLEDLECEGYRDLAYALLATELALADAGLDHSRNSVNVGAIQAFEAPGVESAVVQLYQMMGTPLPPTAPPKVYETMAPFFYKMQPFFNVHVIGKAFGFRGLSTSVHNACSSGAFAVEVAAQQIRAGRADAMVVVGGEAFETAARLEWFHRLELYAVDRNMRPFDPDSSGFYVGEGAGAILLESASHAAQRDAHVYAVYAGGAFAQQGWKQTIPDVRAARLQEVITGAMSLAGISAAELDLVVPHGASTLLSDGYEASCLAKALDGAATDAVATVFKPAVGHLLAASGIIETICALLSMKHQTVPATLGTRCEHNSLPVPLIKASVERPIRTVLKLSTGFTGHDAASLFTAPVG